MKYTEIGGKQVSQITLGTVQLGMNYGIANDGGQPDTEKSRAMLKCALDNGITSIDTARTYGSSEDVVGGFFRENPRGDMPFINSKLKIGLPAGASGKEVEAAMYASVETSLEKLGVNRLDCLMLHSAGEMTAYGGVVAETMKRMTDEGLTAKAGVSVYQPEELDTMLECGIYTATQIPMSVFDQKLIQRGYLKRLKENGVSVFVRSVFLQGLFFLKPDRITDPLLIEYAKPYIEKLAEYCEKENMSIAEFAISYIRDTEGVTSLVLGADSPEQIKENIGYINAPAITENTREMLSEEFGAVNIAKIMEVLSRPKR